MSRHISQETHLGEVRQRARESVHFVNHDRVDQPLLKVGQSLAARGVP
jgi:hypothetical protein